MVKAVVLDMDGVIRHLDLDVAEKASQSRGFNFDELMDILWENDYAHELLCGRSNREEWWANVQTLDTRLEGVPQDFVWNEVLSENYIDNDIIDFVREHRIDLVTGILTNCSKESKSIILETLGDDHPFEYVMSSSDFGFKKPQLEVYRKMLETIGVRAEECIFFDDRITNVEAARKIAINAHLFEGVEQLKKLVIPT